MQKLKNLQRWLTNEKKHQRLEMVELVQEIEMLIDDWHFTKCPYDETGPLYKSCKGCPHIKLCKCEMYKSNGELKNEHL